MPTSPSPLPPRAVPPRPARAAPAQGLLAWLLAALAVTGLEGHVDQAQQAVLLVFGAAIAGTRLSVMQSVVASVLAVLAFDLALVPPHGSLAVTHAEDAALLVTLALATGLVGVLTARQRTLVAEARRDAWREDRLRELGEALREGDDPARHAALLRDALAAATGGRVTLVMADGPLPARRDDAAVRWVGEANEDQRIALWLCLRHARGLGPGSERPDDVRDWVLPVRGRGHGEALGAALVVGAENAGDLADARADAQAMCDRVGLVLERVQALQAASQASETAQAQAVSNAFLAAISHDYRTPLATILGAATSLRDQEDRLSGDQRRALADTIAEEARELDRMTANTLQLARLDAPGARPTLDWESAEEMVGIVLRHARRRANDGGPDAPVVRGRVEPGVPLLRCDAQLMTQLLDNLVDNACRHAGSAGGPVDVVVRREGESIVIAVRDHGPGVAPELRERIFEAFQRGPLPEGAALRGAGLGLAVCRAIARLHGGELTLRSRPEGGCSFECRLPVPEDASPPPPEVDPDRPPADRAS